MVTCYWKTTWKIPRDTALVWIAKQNPDMFVFNGYWLTQRSGCVTSTGRAAMDTALLKAPLWLLSTAQLRYGDFLWRCSNHICPNLDFHLSKSPAVFPRKLHSWVLPSQLSWVILRNTTETLPFLPFYTLKMPSANLGPHLDFCKRHLGALPRALTSARVNFAPFYKVLLGCFKHILLTFIFQVLLTLLLAYLWKGRPEDEGAWRKT